MGRACGLNLAGLGCTPLLGSQSPSLSLLLSLSLSLSLALILHIYSLHLSCFLQVPLPFSLSLSLYCSFDTSVWLCCRNGLNHYTSGSIQLSQAQAHKHTESEWPSFIPDICVVQMPQISSKETKPAKAAAMDMLSPPKPVASTKSLFEAGEAWTQNSPRGQPSKVTLRFITHTDTLSL